MTEILGNRTSGELNSRKLCVAPVATLCRTGAERALRKFKDSNRRLAYFEQEAGMMRQPQLRAGDASCVVPYIPLSGLFSCSQGREVSQDGREAGRVREKRAGGEQALEVWTQWFRPFETYYSSISSPT